MKNIRIVGGLLVVAAVLTGRPAAAQYPVGDRPGPLSADRAYYESRGSGNLYTVPSATFAGRYEFPPTPYSGSSPAGRFATSNGYYSTLPSNYSPIFMTSLNYPGIYGSYAYGIGAATANVATAFQTMVDNPPSDNPVGAPYAPLQRPLADVPYKVPVELNTARQESPQPALIDVILPAEATLSFQGIAMNETGGLRAFQSPPLVPGRSYTYDLRATWKTPEGQEVIRNRHLTVRAGERQLVNLTRAEMPRADELPSERPTLRTGPLPQLRNARPAPQD